MKYCPVCGAENPDDARFCQNCGTNLENVTRKSTTSPPSSYTGTQTQAIHPTGQYYGSVPPEVMAQSKNEVLALVLSLIIPGLGEIYVGKTGKGILLIVLNIILFFTIIAPIIIWIYAMIDSYNLAKKYNALLYQRGVPPDPSEL